MNDWIDDNVISDEDEFVDVAEHLIAADEKGYTARRRLEMMLEEKLLREDLDDYLTD